MSARISAALTAGGYASHDVDTVIQAHFGTYPTEGGAGSPTLTQTYGRVHGLRGTEAAPVLLANNVVVTSGRFRVRLKIACTTANCAAMSPTLRYSRNAGSYTAVPDDFSTDNIRLVGVDAGSDVPTDGTATTELLTSDHATNMVCAVIRTTAAVPAVDLSQNSETECEWAVGIDSDAVPGDTYAFRAYAGTTALDAYTTSPTMTVLEMAAGMGF